jgi:hypothetical protein
MAYRRTWNIRVPVLPDTDEAQLQWLMRESAEKTAAGYLLKVTEFEDLGEVHRDNIAPLGLKQLGPDYNEATFRAFRVVADRDPDASGV